MNSPTLTWSHIVSFLLMIGICTFPSCEFSTKEGNFHEEPKNGSSEFHFCPK